MSEKNFFASKNTLNIKGRALDLSKPTVMGILNITPDSFFSDSRMASVDQALTQAENMLKAGATFIDLGGYSSRPGAEHITAAAECSRLVPVVEALVKNFPEIILSIDTFRAQVAEESILAGAHIINDIAAGDMDPDMFETVARLQVPYIMMHMKGTPQNMQQNPVYKDVFLEVADYFSKKLALLNALHVHDVIIDPGFGFGKTTEHNYQLLKQLQDFKIFNLPLLAGFSRKGMIYKVLGTDAAHALNGTTVLNTIALQKGAQILRVHDVKEAVECIRLLDCLND